MKDISERIKLDGTESVSITYWPDRFLLQTTDYDYAMGVVCSREQLRAIGARLIAIADGAPMEIEGVTE